MKCLYCHESEVETLITPGSPDTPFTLGLCEKCLIKACDELIKKGEEE